MISFEKFIVGFADFVFLFNASCNILKTFCINQKIIKEVSSKFAIVNYWVSEVYFHIFISWIIFG